MTCGLLCTIFISVKNAVMTDRFIVVRLEMQKSPYDKKKIVNFQKDP
jgi:membrane protein CcdC involved in cytochrome C biogenesis